MAEENYDGAIGIDLGTTYSCVALYEGTNVEISMLSFNFPYKAPLTAFQLPTNRVTSPPRLSFLSPQKND
jgi:hypothetical protein